VEGASVRAAKQAREMFCSAVRTTLAACRGYECQEKEGVFMLAFAEPSDALRWACVLHLALLCVHWPREVLDAPDGQEVRAAAWCCCVRAASCERLRASKGQRRRTAVAA
jgi:hypothetical protein